MTLKVYNFESFIGHACQSHGLLTDSVDTSLATTDAVFSEVRDH